MNSKLAITTQVLTMILMSIFMIGIIIFGLNKLLVVEETLSTQESLEVQNEIKNNFEYCDNPLNSQSEINFVVDIDNVNTLCILGESHDNYVEIEEFASIKDAGDNIVLLDAFVEQETSQEYNITGYQIRDSFRVEMDDYSQTKCFTDENTGILKIAMVCN